MSYNKNYQATADTNDRETPWDLYNLLEDEFKFVADMAATKFNTKHHTFFTEEDDSLSIEWPRGPVFLNPPYGRGLIDKFTAKAREQSDKGSTVVMLLAVSTSSIWWFKSIVMASEMTDVEIRFIKPRVKFLKDGEPILSSKGKPAGAMTPNVIVVFTHSPDRYHGYKMRVTWWDWEENMYYS